MDNFDSSQVTSFSFSFPQVLCVHCFSVYCLPFMFSGEEALPCMPPPLAFLHLISSLMVRLIQ